MLETLLGSIVGGALRLAPELFKVLDSRNERAHELAMQGAAIEFEKIRGAQRMAEIGARADAAWDTGALDALKAAVQGQAAPTGVRWADALSSSVRPVITYVFFALYAAVKVAGLIELGRTTGDWSTAVQTAWTSEDHALFASCLNFFFMGRVFDRLR